MTSIRRRAAAVAALIVVCAVASGGAALASTLGPPALRSPRPKQRVHVGGFRLVVYEPGPGIPGNTVYVAIRRNRRLDSYGYLDHVHCNVTKGCDFITLSRWRGHRGYWIYKRQAFGFPGYWATTPGKYYWQASIVAPLCQAKGCTLASRIHSFTVVG